VGTSAAGKRSRNAIFFSFKLEQLASRAGGGRQGGGVGRKGERKFGRAPLQHEETTRVAKNRYGRSKSPHRCTRESIVVAWHWQPPATSIATQSPLAFSYQFFYQKS
jgi:hypothetical protein